MKKFKLVISGFFVGVINALFGAGGGMIAVPVLISKGLNQKQAQATAVSVILPLTLISAIVYYFSGNLNLSAAIPYIPLGFLGAILGSFALKKVPDKYLRKAFAIFMIWAGVRLILK